jgi:hypothetical protein
MACNFGIFGSKERRASSALEKEMIPLTPDAINPSGNAFPIPGTVGESIPGGFRVFDVEVFAVFGGL